MVKKPAAALHPVKKPATALPWHLGMKQADSIVYDSAGWAICNATVYHGHADRADTQANARYIAHACNAYPKLIELVRACAGAGGSVFAQALLRELGEQ